MLFKKTDTVRAPFGKNAFLRSTRDVKTESYTCSAAATPEITIDGETQKVLQPGTVMAKITSGPEAGKVGPFQAGATDGRQTAANVVGVLSTFLPWELMEGDQNVSVVYEATVVQGWCFEWTATPAQVALTNATRDAILALPNLALLFK